MHRFAEFISQVDKNNREARTARVRESMQTRGTARGGFYYTLLVVLYLYAVVIAK